MDNKPNTAPGTPRIPELPPPLVPGPLGRIWRDICTRILNGLLLALPVLITFWLIGWLYSILETKIIDPVAMVLLWKFKWTTSSTELPYWFETFAAPLLAIVVVLALLYCLDYFSDTRLRAYVSWTLRRVPLVSHVYNPVRKVFEALDQQSGQQRPSRMVLIQFPHPGTKLPAFVTAVCRDQETQRNLLCVYVPTTPVPTSGFFLLVPEDEVTELNWDAEQTLQTIISGGLTAPPVVTYFRTKPPTDVKPVPALVSSDAVPRP